jgi:zinc D-Ala-D-Ala carboxypeptidase
MAKWFNSTEIEGLSPRLVILLDQMRELAEIPIFITCGYRSPEHNAEIGGVPNSAHVKGEAVDIRCHDSITRYKLVWAALKVGFKRIGVESVHLHLDISESLPQNVMFLGESK